MENKIVKPLTYKSNIDFKKHRVGGKSEYDNDMYLIEIMVSYSKNKGLDESMILSYYYISKIITFWKVFKEYLYTDDIILNYSPSYLKKSSYDFYTLEDMYNNYKKGDIDFKNKIPKDLVDFYINKKNKGKDGTYKGSGLYFAAKKLEDKSLYEYLNETLSKDEIYNKIFPNLPKDYDENQIILDTTENPKAKVKYIIKNMKYYEEKYYKKLDILNNNIINGLLFDNKLYYDIFTYIASLNCLNLYYEDDDKFDRFFIRQI